MKKMLIVLVGIAVIFAVSGTGYSADVWPPSKTGLMYTYSSSNDLCAIFTLPKGSIEVDCAKKGATSNPTVYTCNPVGATLTCTGGKIIKISDRPAVKCQKLCAPTASSWTSIR